MNYTYYRRYQPRRKQSSFKPFFWLVILIVVAALLLKACVSFVAGINEEKRDEAVLSLEKGSAEVLLWGQDKWVEVSDSQIILEGDSVRTGVGGYVKLDFHNGSSLSMDGGSQVVFSECVTSGENDLITISLFDGRAWLEQVPKEKGQMELVVETDVMNISSMSGEYLVSNLVDDEYIYVMDGQVTIEFMDRGDTDTVIETVILAEGYKSEMSDAKQRALLDRDNVTLSEEIAEDDLFEDAFVAWSTGVVLQVEADEEEEVVVVEEEIEVEEDVEVEEEVVDLGEELVIEISSPDSPITIFEDAIAIEGYISSGIADEVYITWSGDGAPYKLGLFEEGGETFRYVADLEYANFAAGENTYTVVAYGPDGNVSNIVTIVITGE